MSSSTNYSQIPSSSSIEIEIKQDSQQDAKEASEATWRCSQGRKVQVVDLAIASARSETDVITKARQRPCCEVSCGCCTRVLLTILKIVTLGGFCGLISLCKLHCCDEKKGFSTDDDIVNQADTIRLLPAWSYNAYPRIMRWTHTSCCFKNIQPWASSQFKNEEDVHKAARGLLFQDRQTEHLTLITPDEVALDGIFLRGKSKKVIYFAPGITGTYEELALEQGMIKSYITFFKEAYKDVNILMVNPRGIGLSQGETTPNTLKVDAYTAIKYLLSRGFGCGDILVWGHSLGGAYALQGAALVQAECADQQISVVNDRSFLRISRVAENRFGCCGSTAKQYVETRELEIDVQDAADTIKGRLIAIASKEDETIPYQESAFLSNVETRNITHLVPVVLENGLPYPHTRAFSKKEVTQLAQIVKDTLDKKWKITEKLPSISLQPDEKSDSAV
jgi:hypothetical protein